MYKYVIYCSISAAILIVCKYVYQNWLKQKNIILELHQNISLLQNRVKVLETELEKNKNSISGGMKIPIEFKPIEKKSNTKTIQFSQNNVNTVEIPNTIHKLSSEQESNDTSMSEDSWLVQGMYTKKVEEIYKPDTISLSSKSSSNNGKGKSLDSKSSSNSKKEKQFTLDLTKDDELKKPEENLQSSKTLEENLESSETLEEDFQSSKTLEEDFQSSKTLEEDISMELGKKGKKKKSSLPDPKIYNNGDKCEENGVQYICVVGKRGGKSWKKFNF